MKIANVTAKIAEKSTSEKPEFEMHWYDLPGALDGFESNPEFLEKMAIDDFEEKPPQKEVHSKKHSMKKRECSWVRKREYKKKLVRRFLTINPDMVFSGKDGNYYCSAWIICSPAYYEGGFFDPKVDYSFNRYTHVYLSPRGDIRKWNGAVYDVWNGCYFIDNSERWAWRAFNRKIRYQPITEETNYTYPYYKKMYFPLSDRYF